MGWEDESKSRRKNDGSGPPEIEEIIRNLINRLKPKKNPFDNREGGSSGGGDFNGISFNLRWLWLGAGIVVFIWILMGFYVINQQERALVLRLGKFNSILEPGLRWNPYFIDTVEKVNVTAVRSLSTSGLMLTQDENIIQAMLTVQFVVDNARDYLLKVKDPLLTLNNALDSALRHVVGSSTMNRVLTDGRADVAEEVSKRLQTYLESYQAGISVVKVNIQSTQAPAQVQEAFDDVIKAREDEQRFRNEARTYSNGIIPEARGQGQRILQDAMAYKQQRIEQALGETERFLKILTEYHKAPQVTKERMYQETTQRILQNTSKVIIDGSKNNSVIYLPLEKILEKARTQGEKRSEPTVPSK